MDRKILADLLRYMEFLQSRGIPVSLSCLHPRFRVFSNQSFPYKYHRHSVCSYLKGSSLYSAACTRNITRLGNQALTAPVYTCCHAGVEEWVIPILYCQERLAYVHISGFRDHIKTSAPKRRKLRDDCGEELGCLFDRLSPEPPDLWEVLSYTQPLQYMFEALYHACAREQQTIPSGSRELYLRAMNYIHQKYMNHLTVQALSQMLNCSESYLQHMFRRERGQTVHDTVRQVRLEHAAQLLRATRLSVTHIAARCGFSDSNYFSAAFRKAYGQTPTQYRRTEKTTVETTP